VTETTNHEAMQVIIRCDGCGAPMLTRFANGEFEFSLYYATLCRTRPLREGPEVSFPDGTKVTLREAPGFCSQPCFDVVTEKPKEFDGRLAEHCSAVFRGWAYLVRWDHRARIHVEPPLAPSVLTKVVTALRERAGLIERKP
jgi:hypothetical protein